MAVEASHRVGAVATVVRYPLKSMQGETLAQAEVAAGGIVGDRAYALVDIESGRVVSAKSARLFGRMLDCHAGFVDEPSASGVLPPIRIVLADGSEVRSDHGGCDGALTRFFGRDVRLVRASGGDQGFTPLYDEAYDDTLGPPLVRRLGMPAAWAARGFQDVLPVSIVTTASLRALAGIRPDSRFEFRRFRMNLLVDVAADGFVEDGWVDGVFAFDGGVRIRVAAADPRCVMTTLPQGDLPKDPEILRTIARHNPGRAVPVRDQPCLGVYAAVECGGWLRAGEALARTA